MYPCKILSVSNEDLLRGQPLTVLTSTATSYGWLGTGVEVSYHLLATLSPPEWLCIKADSCFSLTVWAMSRESVHKLQFLKRKESRSESNRGPPAYQPHRLATPAHKRRLKRLVLINSSKRMRSDESNSRPPSCMPRLRIAGFTHSQPSQLVQQMPGGGGDGWLGGGGEGEGDLATVTPQNLAGVYASSQDRTQAGKQTCQPLRHCCFCTISLLTSHLGVPQPTACTFLGCKWKYDFSPSPSTRFPSY